MKEVRCKRCGKFIEGGHPRDGSDKCWCSEPVADEKRLKKDEEAKRTRRITDLAAEEVRYLRDAGWIPVMVGPKNEIRFKDPRYPSGILHTQSHAVEVQKGVDEFSKIFP